MRIASVQVHIRPFSLVKLAGAQPPLPFFIEFYSPEQVKANEAERWMKPLRDWTQKRLTATNCGFPRALQEGTVSVAIVRTVGRLEEDTKRHEAALIQIYKRVFTVALTKENASKINLNTVVIIFPDMPGQYRTTFYNSSQAFSHFTAKFCEQNMEWLTKDFLHFGTMNASFFPDGTLGSRGVPLPVTIFRYMAPDDKKFIDALGDRQAKARFEEVY